MNRHQQEILKIFKEYKRICDKYNLIYFAIGGTCIGAIRHKGFIPWDDDLDVAMPIDDYNRFVEIAKNELATPYELYDYRNHRHCSFRFIKIHNTQTTFIEEQVKQYEDRYIGIFIDVMPISGIIANKKKQKKFLYDCFFNTKLDYANRFEYSKISTLKMKLFSIITYPIRKNKAYNYYAYRYGKLLKQYDYSSANDVLFTWRIPLEGNYKNIFPYSIFESAIEVPFEDTSICVPVGYDEYLKRDFGDYMKLPPKSKQVPLHNYAVLDFDKPYTVYQNFFNSMEKSK